MLTKVTWACAVIFFSTSIFLAYMSTRRVTGSIFTNRSSASSQTVPSGKAAPVSHTPPAAPAPANKTR